ncbi:WG repeat-containing protein [Paludibaculum fermentans]|uniref:WG repeat-containing protein n=1 Tax=Paludibaculum fermentans TaxID=1473598 RepID=A0A7S7NL95_PALFE|nr:WG repeat-containing protein [Paludibaculum fermentans]QOY85696.1 WG repeat-containing protein [Paludibaculum fermentans]
MRLLALFTLLATVLNGCESVTLIWMPFTNSADPLFRIIENDRAGYIDAQGRVVIPPTLRFMSEGGQAFHDGLLSLGISAGPFLDSKGQKVLDNHFYRVWNFSEGLAAAMETSESAWGYIDRSGQFVIPPKFPFYPKGAVSDFSEGLAAVEVEGKLGYIDRTGAFVIPPQFAAGTSFENGLARVVVNGPCSYMNYDSADPCMAMSPAVAPTTRNDAEKPPAPTRQCQWIFIDKTGRRAISSQFEGAMAFHEGLAAVRSGDQWGFLNRQGAYEIYPAFEAVHSFSDGLALVSNGKDSGFIDRTGALKIRVDYYHAKPFSEGLTVIRTPEDRYIYVDTTGKQAIPETFLLASRFFHGLAHVKLTSTSKFGRSGTYAYIDKTGKRVYEYTR